MNTCLSNVCIVWHWRIDLFFISVMSLMVQSVYTIAFPAVNPLLSWTIVTFCHQTISVHLVTVYCSVHHFSLITIHNCILLFLNPEGCYRTRMISTVFIYNSYFQPFSFLSFGCNADWLLFSCMWHVKSKGSLSLSLSHLQSPAWWRSLWLLVGLNKISEIISWLLNFEMCSWLRCLISSAILPWMHLKSVDSCCHAFHCVMCWCLK